MVSIKVIEVTDNYGTTRKLNAVKAKDPGNPCDGCVLRHTIDCIAHCDELVKRDEHFEVADGE